LKKLFGSAAEQGRTVALLTDSGLADDVPLDALYELEVVGESHYQDVIERIAGAKSEGGKQMRVGLTLRCEPDNPHDSDAVRVECMGQLVGYIARDEAADLSPELIETRGSCIEARGLILGGWKRPDSEGHFGVRAWLDPKDAIALGLADPLMDDLPPPLPGERRLSPRWENQDFSIVTVTCEEHYQEAIEGSRPSGSRRDTWTTLVTFVLADQNPHVRSTDPCIEVRLSDTGKTCGYLTHAMTERHRPTITGALAVNERPTAVASVYRGEKGGQRIWRIKVIMRKE
jgi:hypothetical protein